MDFYARMNRIVIVLGIISTFFFTKQLVEERDIANVRSRRHVASLNEGEQFNAQSVTRRPLNSRADPAQLTEKFPLPTNNIPEYRKALSRRILVVDALNKNHAEFTALGNELQTLLRSSCKLISTSINFVDQTTLKNIIDYRNLLSKALNKINTCRSAVVYQKIEHLKPDYQAFFCSELDSPETTQLFKAIKQDLSEGETKIHIFRNLQQMNSIVRHNPDLCSQKWEIERVMERCANGEFYFATNILSPHDLAYNAHIPRKANAKEDQSKDKENAEETRNTQVKQRKTNSAAI